MWWMRKKVHKTLAFFYKNEQAAKSYAKKYGGVATDYILVDEVLPEGELTAYLTNDRPLKNNYSDNLVVYYFDDGIWNEFGRFASTTEANAMAKKLIDFYKKVIVIYEHFIPSDSVLPEETEDSEEY